MASTAEPLTAEQFTALSGALDHPVELMKGSLVETSPAMPRHGQICFRTAYLLQRYLDDHPTGVVITNDSNILTQRNPDTVRGADVAYYSYDRVPRGPLPGGLLPVAPELVFEVLSPQDRWSELHVKIAEYLGAGVQTVCVLDDDTRALHAFFADRPLQVFAAQDPFELPERLPGLQVTVERFFE